MIVGLVSSCRAPSKEWSHPFTMVVGSMGSLVFFLSGWSGPTLYEVIYTSLPFELRSFVQSQSRQKVMLFVIPIEALHSPRFSQNYVVQMEDKPTHDIPSTAVLTARAEAYSASGHYS